MPRALEIKKGTVTPPKRSARGTTPAFDFGANDKRAKDKREETKRQKDQEKLEALEQLKANATKDDTSKEINTAKPSTATSTSSPDMVNKDSNNQAAGPAVGYPDLSQLEAKSEPDDETSDKRDAHELAAANDIKSNDGAREKTNDEAAKDTTTTDNSIVSTTDHTEQSNNLGQKNAEFSQGEAIPSVEFTEAPTSTQQDDDKELEAGNDAATTERGSSPAVSTASSTSTIAYEDDEETRNWTVEGWQSRGGTSATVIVKRGEDPSKLWTAMGYKELPDRLQKMYPKIYEDSTREIRSQASLLASSKESELCDISIKQVVEYAYKGEKQCPSRYIMFGWAAAPEGEQQTTTTSYSSFLEAKKKEGNRRFYKQLIKGWYESHGITPREDGVDYRTAAPARLVKTNFSDSSNRKKSPKTAEGIRQFLDNVPENKLEMVDRYLRARSRSRDQSPNLTVDVENASSRQSTPDSTQDRSEMNNLTAQVSTLTKLVMKLAEGKENPGFSGQDGAGVTRPTSQINPAYSTNSALGVQPGMMSMQPGMMNNMQPGMMNNMQPGMMNMQPGMMNNMQPSMMYNMQPGTMMSGIQAH